MLDSNPFSVPTMPQLKHLPTPGVGCLLTRGIQVNARLFYERNKVFTAHIIYRQPYTVHPLDAQYPDNMCHRIADDAGATLSKGTNYINRLM